MDWLSQLGNALDVKLFAIGKTPVTLATVVTLLLVVIASWWISRLVQRGLTKAADARGIRAKGTVAAANRLVHYSLMLLGLGIALQTAGVDLSALFAAGAVFAVAIGFAMQNITQNFVSGIILLVERAIKPGDIIELEGRLLRVVEMGIRATICRTNDEDDIIVPNAELVQGKVKNLTLRDDLHRVRVSVGTSYDTNVKQVFDVLQEVGRAVPMRLEDREPRVLFTDFADSSLNFELSVWVDDPWAQPLIRSEMRTAIRAAFLEHEIEIAFPQLDVHFDAEPPRLELAS